MKLVISIAAIVSTLAAVPVPASAVPTDVRPSSSIPRATVKASAMDVTEGDRLSLRVRVPQSTRARRVILQERRINIFGDPDWEDLAAKAARARTRFRTTVTAINTGTLRVAVTYAGRSTPVVSRPIRVRVWRWIPLREFTPYFESPLASYGEADMNGDRYAVWGSYAGTAIRAWEARLTLGRKCTKFRAVLGLADTSDAGSSGVISFTVEEAATIYQSPPLTPGMTVPVLLDLPKPYRFGMAASNTSPDKVNGYPMVGDGAFLCTGISG